MPGHNFIDREVQATPESWGQHFGPGVDQMLFLWYSAGFGGGGGRKTTRYEFNPCIQTHQKKKKNSREINHVIRIDTVGGKCNLISAGCSQGDGKENRGSLGIVDLKLIY